MSPRARALVMAKAPVAGRVKTRLGQDVGMLTAARLAAAALLDTIDACSAAFGAEHCHLALDGDLRTALDGGSIQRALAGWSVSAQRGDSFAARLVNAHAEVATAGPGVVVQIGMDTPQVTPELLTAVVATFGDGAVDAVLGPAPDGGWWVLALRDAARAAPVAGVAMSVPTTFADTRDALTRAGLRVVTGATLSDVDTVADAVAVATAAPDTRFAQAWASVDDSV